MNCRDIGERLSAGTPLTPLEQEHIASCAGCRQMLEMFATPEEAPSRQRLNAITAAVANDLQPVTPLPSDLRLVLIALGFFLVFTLLTGAISGLRGARQLSAGQQLPYYLVILLWALLCSIMLVQQWVPGVRKRLNEMSATVLALVVAAAVIALLFPVFDTDHFVALGLPCLVFGSGCALMFAGVISFFLRRGYCTSPLQALVTTALFSGLAGIAVLALHCPIQNALHILVWHFGAITVAILVAIILFRITFFRKGA